MLGTRPDPRFATEPLPQAHGGTIVTTRRGFLAGGTALAGMLGAIPGALAQDATPGADETCPALDAAAMDALGRGWATA